MVGSTVQKIPPGKYLLPQSKNATGVVEEAMSSSYGGTPCIIQITCYTECEQTVCEGGVGDNEEGRDGRAGRGGYSKTTGDSCLILPLLLSTQWASMSSFTNRNLLDIGFPKCHCLCVPCSAVPGTGPYKQIAMSTQKSDLHSHQKRILR